MFDIKIQTPDGIFVEHVYRNDSAPYSDAIWWQSLAENQNPDSSPDTSSAPDASNPDSNPVDQPASSDSSPDTSSAPDASNPDSNPVDQPASSSVSDSPRISSNQAIGDARTFATTRGYQVMGVKKCQVTSKGQKVYYQVKLQLGKGGRNHGTTTIWVDASSSPGTVTAAAGQLKYRDANIVSPSTAEANAMAAVGGGSQFHPTSLHGGKWRWYWVFLSNGSVKYKVGVDAATGVVTEVSHN
ncbi:MAG: PepSY domain-containing protein [Acidimicrobiales bacterium]